MSNPEYDFSDEESTVKLALKTIRPGDLVFVHPEAKVPTGFWGEVRAKEAYAVDRDTALRFAKEPPARMAVE
jgi:regulator of RNase E activity RraA